MVRLWLSWLWLSIYESLFKIHVICYLQLSYDLVLIVQNLLFSRYKAFSKG